MIEATEEKVALTTETKAEKDMSEMMRRVLGFLVIIVWLAMLGLVKRKRRHIPAGIGHIPVELLSPTGKSYGVFPLIQAERIVSKQWGWTWKVGDRKKGRSRLATLLGIK